MPDVFQYYGRFQSVRGQFGSLPPWARSVVSLFAIPGILLIGLSIVLLLVSILALFLLTAPVYRLLQVMTGSGRMNIAPAAGVEPPAVGGVWAAPGANPGRKSVQVRVVE